MLGETSMLRLHIDLYFGSWDIYLDVWDYCDYSIPFLSILFITLSMLL